MIPLLFFMAAAAAPQCAYVSGDRIYARDLVTAAPAFAHLPPGLPVSWSPAPGNVRTIAAAELQRMAKLNGLDPGPAVNACFEWRMHIPSDAELLSAMQAALAPRHVEIKIVERSKYPVPEGTLAFSLPPLAGIGHTAPILWTGAVKYAPHRTCSLWARVLMEGSGTRVIAAEPLRAGEPIRANQLRTEEWSGPLESLDTLASPALAIGLMPKTAIAAGSPLRSALLAKPPDVLQGDTVEVRVNWGHAHLKTEAVAEQAGSIGGMIRVRNTASGKRFRAHVDGKDLVSINARI